MVIEIGDEGRGVAPYPEIRELALQAESSGLDSIWVYDHLLFRADGRTSGIHEGWTMLAALAEATGRISWARWWCAPGSAIRRCSRRWRRRSTT